MGSEMCIRDSIYAIFSAGQVIFILFGTITLALAAIIASRSLHSGMLKNILRSPMSFFDTTPLGRVLNRFSKDIYIIDEAILNSLRPLLVDSLRILSTIVVIVIATPTFSTVVIPLGIFYFLVQV